MTMRAPRKSSVDTSQLEFEPLAAAVHADVDGYRSAAAIVARASRRFGVPHATAFRVLDALADLGLLSAQATPPIGNLALSRRLVLRGAAAGLVTLGMTPLATAQPQAEPSPTPGAETVDDDFRRRVERFDAKKRAQGDTTTGAPGRSVTPTPRAQSMPALPVPTAAGGETGALPKLPQPRSSEVERRQEQTVKKDQERYDKLLERR